MIKVYSADNTTQAYLIANVLEKHGIPATVRGSDSLHGIGQPITVWIKNSLDEGRAKEVLEQCVAEDKDTGEEYGIRTRKKATTSRFVTGMIAGVFIGLALSHYYPTSDEQSAMPASHDRNADGKADVWYEYDSQGVAKESYDQDYDARVDAWYFYDKGILVRVEADRNRDSHPDEWAEYHSSGDLLETRYDLNFDGNPDYWERYSSGVATSYTSDNNHDGTVDEWGDIKNGRITERKWSFHDDDVLDKIAKYRDGRKYEESFDRNRDGVFEEAVVYDEFERVIADE